MILARRLATIDEICNINLPEWLDIELDNKNQFNLFLYPLNNHIYRVFTCYQDDNKSKIAIMDNHGKYTNKYNEELSDIFKWFHKNINILHHPLSELV